jgi:tetratricopeptide (TPR) repeat protein
MTEKIEWYKEVLELEPNSKVFFPLARLLKAENRCDEAMGVLEQGLERHPEFLEARLLFIELLHKADRRALCAEQTSKISAIFSGYAEFWQAWAACLATDGTSPDMPILLRFIAAHFMRPPLSLHEVFDKGIAAILNQAADAQDPSLRGSASKSIRQNGDATQNIFPAEDIARQSLDDQSTKAAASPDDAPRPPAPSSAVIDEPEQAEAAKIPIVEEPDETEEHFSLRTRSMAEVLAEQGDIKGALDIYQELAAAVTVPVEKADLLQRIATLNAKLVMAAAMPAALTAPETEVAAEKIKLISKLEALAERVEARAHG